MKAPILILAALVLAGCAGLPDLPAGHYDVYPVDMTLAPEQEACYHYGGPNGLYAACIHSQPLPTASPFATPTPEVGPLPTPTVTPTVTPTPAPACYAVNNLAVGIRVRAAYSVTAAQVGSLEPGARAVVSQRYTAPSGDRWARIPAGWVATWYGGATIATLTGACEQIPVEARASPAIGVRTVPGAVGFEAMYPILADKGIPYGVSPYNSLSYCTSALQQGGVCIFRPGAPDCPTGVGTTDPLATARAFMQHAAFAALVLKGADGAFIEVTNECQGTPISPTDAVWWRDFYNEYIEQAAAQGWPSLAIPGLPPGHGDAHLFRVWKPMLMNLNSHGGLLSMHDYTFNSRTGLCVCDIYEACRHILNHNLMLEQGYSIPIAITEAARWAGEAPVDVDDFVCWIGKVQGHEYVHSLWLWLGGFNPQWSLANLDGHYVEIAERVQ